jgi:YHS domain-containing protein
MNKIFIWVLALLLSSPAMAQHAAERLNQYNVQKNGLALDGYDAVAYFKLNLAVKGKQQFAVAYDGLLYYFSSGENKEQFKQSPSKYEPQYGGWCAYAMGSSGEKVEVDPETFKVKDGKLFLFYNKYFNNTLKSWNKDEVNLNHKADLNWNKIANQH